MSSSGSITHWISQLKTGPCPTAAHQVYNNYFTRLVHLARHKLLGVPRRAADEEDVALSALNSFLRGAAGGRFPRLDDREDLWQLLVLITDRKAKDLARHEKRLKRSPDGKGVFDEAALAGGAPGAPDDLGQVPDAAPSPEFAAEMAEQCRRLLDVLGADLRQIALWKMESRDNHEIAGLLGCAERTVSRKLAVIRSLWKKEGLA